MKVNETRCTGTDSGNVKLLAHQHAAGGYAKVFDQRKQRVRGLWMRNGTFYAQLTIPHPVSGLPVVRRVRLEDKDGKPVDTLPQAIAGMNKMKVQREDEVLKVAAKRTPTLSEYGATYIERLKQLGSVKRPDTIALEQAMLKSLCGAFGGLRLREVSPLVVHSHMAARVQKGASARTVNLEVITLRNVLKSAIKDHLLNVLPQFERLKELTPKRRCLTSEEVERLAKVALEFPRTGAMLAQIAETYERDAKYHDDDADIRQW